MSNPLFTPESARRELRALRPTVERMCRLVREMQRRRPVRIVPDQRVEGSYFAMVWKLHGQLAEIRRRGARVGDLGTGVLDFPARRNGRRVWLCWKVGEPTLSYWHEAGTGYDGRRRVDEDGPWEEA